MGQSQNSYTPEQRKEVERYMEKLVQGALKTGVTAAAVAGAGVVSLFKRDASPLRKTWDWCKSGLWDK